ncbi:hypothetical protein BGX28_009109, partial [Mortierella sp. GBA30]
AGMNKLATFNIVLESHSQKTFSWSIDPTTATMGNLRQAIEDERPELFEGATIICVGRTPELDEFLPVMESSDKYLQSCLQNILLSNDGSREQDLIVNLDTPSKPFSEYTASDIGNMYGFCMGFKDLPVISDIPDFDVVPYPEKNEHALRRLCDELESRIENTILDGSGVIATFIFSFLVWANSIFKQDLTVSLTKEIKSRRGQGSLHYAIQSKVDPTSILAVTEVKDGDFQNGLAQNMVRLEAISRGRKRKLEVEENSIRPVVSYGLVTDAQEWHFVECTLPPTTRLLTRPSFCHSKMSKRIQYHRTKEEWQSDVRNIFGRVVWVVDEMMKNVPKRRKTKE